MRTKPLKKPKSHLQEVFLKRVMEEMEKQQVSGNALAGRVGGPPQRTLADVLNGADPRLETVQQIADALSLPPWKLLVEAGIALDQQTQANAEEKPYKLRVNSGTKSQLSHGKTGPSAKHRLGKKG